MPTPEYHPRLADRYLADLLTVFPAVMINGARATGKTTTATQFAAQIERLDQPGVAAAYRADPDAALRRAARPLLLDEWQEVPTVLGAVKRAVDAGSQPGQFILTGSVRADLQHETWAGTGRTVRMSMYPLSERELRQGANADAPPFLQRLASSGIDDLHLPTDVPDIDGYVDRALRSGFPELAYRERTPEQQAIWLASYLDDLITRDARTLDINKDPTKLRRYLHALALNNAGMPADATLYRAADVNAKTAASYDRLLRDLYILDIIPAWTNNRIDRLLRAGKRCLVDTGLAASAAGLTRQAVLKDHDLLGRWFEAFAIAQLRSEVALMQPQPTLHHLRQESGRREIDLLVELSPDRLIAIECKAGSAPDDRDARHLIWLRDRLGAQFVAGVVLHAGPAVYQLDDRVYAIPLCAMWG